jgi:DNA-binding response OmpR family regulator
MAETYQILIVDDEPDILSTYKNFFEKRGYVVETAENGKEGLEKIRNGDFDVAIVDIGMPEMNGFEMIRKANEDDIDPEWIILTGHGQANEVIEALKLGVVDWFNKESIEMSELLEKVRKLTYGHLDDVRRIFTRIREDMRTEQHSNE